MTSLDSTATESAAAQADRVGKLAMLLQHSLVRFLMAGGLSVAVDMGLLFVLHGVMHVQLTAATLIAVVASFLLNFVLNRVWSFGSAAPVGGQLVRYLILAALNWVSTVLLVNAFTALGLFYLLAKLLTVLINSTVNYVAYRLWVFKTD